MNFIADFHIHSKYSRATAKNLDFENLYINAQIKGITLLGTGDFTHPAWWQEIQDKLVPAQGGLFKLKPDIARACDEKVPSPCRRPVRFMLVTEISNIYKKGDRTRKNHNLVFMPDLESAEQFNRRLDTIGNIKSDGRPILGLDARNLLEIVLETDERAFLVPAHIWTPWFSLLGSKSGYDSVEECFEDLTPHIFALETGLSSDPPMNWRVSRLDGYTLISNSDAHSPSKLGREANRFNTQLSYGAVRTAMETADPDQFLGTIEFYPEEGKYHVDGHRKCNFRSSPGETRELEGLCPVCGKPLTLGVLYRVEQLADRQEGDRPLQHSPYKNLIPLEDVLSEVLQVGVKSKKVSRAYSKLIEANGSEFDILCDLPVESLEKSDIPLLAEAVRRMREGHIVFDPGFDGEFGRVRIFNPSERDSLTGQQSLFDLPDEPVVVVNKGEKQTGAAQPKQRNSVNKHPEDGNDIPVLFSDFQPPTFQLNPEQQAAVDHESGPLLISAGPGTGKTRTITCRIASLIEKGGVNSNKILAVTFTNKAAEEMRHRLVDLLPPKTDLPLVATFHGFCWQMLKAFYDNTAGGIVDQEGRRAILSDAMDMVHGAGQPINLSTPKLLDMIVEAKQQLLGPTDDLSPVAGRLVVPQLTAVYKCYQQLLTLQELFDFEDLVFQIVNLLEKDRSYRKGIQKRFSHIFVDEFQDINDAQYRLLRALAPSKAQICVIGDPDQAIYGFRGSDIRYFKQFTRDYDKSRIIQLNRNYRSTETILASSFQVIQGHQPDLETGDHVRTYSDIRGMETLSVIETATPQAEAVAIGKTIEQMVGGTGFHSMDFEKIEWYDAKEESGFDDFAILCRTGEQVQQITRQLSSAGIPCQMVSRRILQQPAIIKLMAALRVITFQGVYSDLNHLLDLGASGISKETLRRFKQWAYNRQLPFATALHSVNRLPIPTLSNARQQRMAALVRLIDKLQKSCSQMSVTEALAYIVDQTTLSSKVEEEDLDRLMALAEPYKMDKKRFTSTSAIQSDTDFYQPGVEKVSVMTLHASKGLEFPVVFLAGCEDSLLPYHRPGKDDIDVDEERRLFYVGMTRARKQLYLTWARKRTVFGRTQTQQLSPFVADIEKKLKTHITTKGKQQKPKPKQLSLF